MSALILNVAQQQLYQARLVAMRRSLHAIAETSLCEWKTTEFICKQALNCDASVHSFYQPDAPLPGLYADIKIPDHAPDATVIAVRCDIDALPVKESQAAGHKPFAEGFASRNGNMHACGHDGHMALTLVLMQMLSEKKHLFKNSRVRALRFIFQPGEEGCRGARLVLKDPSVLKDVSELYCFHLGMGLGSGYFAPAAQDFLATLKFDITIKGRSSHAGHPEQGANALRSAVDFMSRAFALMNPQERTLCNFANVNTNAGTRNIIPDLVTFEGELRCHDNARLHDMHQEFLKLLAQCCSEQGTAFTFEEKGLAHTIRQNMELAYDLGALAFSQGFKLDYKFPFSASEDASLLIEEVQKQGGRGVYSVIGANIAAGHHLASFDFDETVLIKGLMLYYAYFMQCCQVKAE